MEYILTFVLIAFLIKWIIGSTGAKDIERLHHRIRQLEREVGVIRTRVDILAARIHADGLPEEYSAEEAVAVATDAEETKLTETAPNGVVIAAKPETIAASSIPSDPARPQIVTDEQPPLNEVTAYGVLNESIIQSEPVRQDKPQPSFPEKIWHWLISGNPILKVGIVVLFLGLGFLLRFASEHFSFSVQARYFSVATIGIGCGVIGWRLRNRYREYALTMQGASIAILYLTALATLKLHSLLPPVAVLIIQVGLVALMAFWAVIQDARILAQVALLGGLAAPVLISDGSGNYIGLFAYLSLLNIGVAGVAWFKAWRSLNILGAAGTTLIAFAWGALGYRPEYFFYCEIFLIFHTVLYTFIVWRFAVRRATETERFDNLTDNNADLETVFSQWWNSMRHIGILDSGLLFGTAFAAFGLQSAMVYSWPHGVMWSALGFASFYGGLGYFILRRFTPLKLVAEAVLFLALVFVTLAIGDSFDGWHKTTLWAIEGMLMYRFGLRQQSPVTRFGALNIFIGAWLFYSLYLIELTANYSLLNSLFLILSGIGLYRLWHRFREGQSAQWETGYARTVLIFTLFSAFMLPFAEYQIGRLSNEWSLLSALVITMICAFIHWRKENVLLACAVVIGLFATVVQYEVDASWLTLLALSFTAGLMAWSLHHPRWIQTKLSDIYQTLGYLLLIFSMAACFAMWNMLNLFIVSDGLYAILITFALPALLAYVLHWRQAGIVTLAFMPLWTLISMADVVLQWGDFSRLSSCFVLCVLSVLLHGFILFVQHTHISDTLRFWWHTLGLNVLVLNFTRLCVKLVERTELGDGWYAATFALVPLLAIMTILFYRDNIRQWGLGRCYLGKGCCPVWFGLGLWFIFGNIHSSASAVPLPYIPLLNPMESASAAFAYLLWRWYRESTLVIERNHLLAAMGAGGLFMLSVMVMRLWHHYAGIDWRFDNLVRSFSVQASLSVIWAIGAIVLMLSGHKRNERKIWFAGAGLVGVVVLKLFLVELGDSGGIARIVSFIAVGILLLLVGYFAPLPPKARQA